jgi:FMN phosphatase YigB (HAD superfamily)
MNKPKAIIVDIDNTLANIDHRLHFIEKKKVLVMLKTALK